MSGPLSALEVGEYISNGLIAIGGINDAKSRAELISSLGQAAGFFSTIALSPVTAGAAIAANAGAAATTGAKVLHDIQNGRNVDVGDLAFIAGNVAVIAASVVITTSPASRAARVANNISSGIGLIGMSSFLINKAQANELAASNLQNDFALAQNFVRPRDPLVLDLDGDGIETVGASSSRPVLFDGDGDGIKTGTGWIAADDGFLVLDRDGNGTIDSGRELFGDSTQLRDGRTAADGFAALADQDSNADGRVTAADAAWSQLRVWRDLNQDGESQTNELFGLEQFGINGLTLAKTANSQWLANGNRVADLGSFTTSDGGNGRMGDVDLAENTFLRQFSDVIALAAGVSALPDMSGSGMVRNLREAASLESGQALKTTLQSIASETSRAGRLALVDTLILQWSATSTLPTSRSTGLNITFDFVTPDSPRHAQLLERLEILERFNGQIFRAVTGNITLLVQQQALLDQSYAALKTTVYQSIAAQTWLKPYLERISY
jgi:hypothetical protein